jgi:predicted phage tail protein
MTKSIKGAGGFFGGKPKAPYRAPDTLESKQFATVLDLLSEGEIEGFATPSKKGIARSASHYLTSALSDVFLDDTSILNINKESDDYLTRVQNTSNSDFNYSDVTFRARYGISSQTPLQNIENEGSEGGNEITAQGGLTCTQASGGRVLTITDSNPRTIQVNGETVQNPARVDAVKLVISFPELQKFEDDGDIYGSEVELKIQLAYVGDNGDGGTNSNNTGGFATVVGSDNDFDPNSENNTNEIISGRSKDLYQKQYLINLDANNSFSSVQIKVIRKTADSSDTDKLRDAFKITSLTKVFHEKLSYDDCAYVGVRVDSEQFSSVPKRAYRIRGIKCRIPGKSALEVTANFSYEGTVVTVTTSSVHGLVLGDFITVKDGNSNINGFHGLTETPDPTGAPSGVTFKYSVSANNTGSAVTGTLKYQVTPNTDIADGRINYPAGYVFGGEMGVTVWTSCPSMILLDLLTNSRYGFGQYLDPTNSFTTLGTSSTIDIQSFVAASRYANEKIGDEARFSCNLNLQTATDAYDLINALAGVMRCMPIWTSGRLSLSQDKPTDATYLFSLANVSEAGFNYSGASARQRHTVIRVSFFNNETREIDYAVYGDDLSDPVQKARIDKFGIIEKTVKAFGCTSEAQALRLARAIVFSEEEESEVVTFTTSIDAGSVVRPGSVINVNDPVRLGHRVAGRIKAISSDRTEITVDDATNLMSILGLEGGGDFKLTVIRDDGILETENIIESGTTSTVIKTQAFSDHLKVNNIWIAESTTAVPQSFRVVNIEEQDGTNYVITAIKYNEGKYANIDAGTPIVRKNISLINADALAPEVLNVEEQLVLIRNKAVNQVLVTWPPVFGVSQYQLKYRYKSGSTVGGWNVHVLFSPDFIIPNTVAGGYQIEVRAYNALQKLSNAKISGIFTTVGKSDPPGDIQNLTAELVGDDNIRLRWDESIDTDVLHGGYVYIKHSSLLSGATWENSSDITSQIAGSSTEFITAALTGTYLAKFVDDGNRRSKNAKSITLSNTSLLNSKVAHTVQEQNGTPFAGAKTNVAVPSSTSYLALSSTNSTGIYTFENEIDLDPNNLGNDFVVNVERILVTQGEFINALTISQLIPDPPPSKGGPSDGGWNNYAKDGNFSGSPADKVNCKMRVQTKKTSDSSFSEPLLLGSGTFTTKFLKFSLELSSTSTIQNIRVIQAGYNLIFPFRSEFASTDASGNALRTQNAQGNPAPKVVTFQSPFFTGAPNLSAGTTGSYKPQISITVDNQTFAQSFVLSNISGTGFTIDIKDKDGNTIDKTFSYNASGFGKGV